MKNEFSLFLKQLIKDQQLKQNDLEQQIQLLERKRLQLVNDHEKLLGQLNLQQAVRRGFVLGYQASLKQHAHFSVPNAFQSPPSLPAQPVSKVPEPEPPKSMSVIPHLGSVENIQNMEIQPASIPVVPPSQSQQF